MKPKRKTPILDKLLEDGFEDLRISITQDCETYGRRLDRVLYDTQFDRIMATYKMEELKKV